MGHIYLLSHIIILTNTFRNNKIRIALGVDNIFKRKSINVTIVVSMN
jgi:hypothetical protein